MFTQFRRYVIVGLGSNIVLYLGYLMLTNLGVEYFVAMTVLYLIGVLQTFLFNNEWTFGFRGNSTEAFMRYVSCYLLGYVINFSGLYVFVGKLGFRHELVQGAFIIFVALIMFVLQKTWVFKGQEERQKRGERKADIS